MSKNKILIAGCQTPSISTDIQACLEKYNYKVNVIGDITNISVSVMLDKPSILCIHFHEFTHNALTLSKELFEKYGIYTIFIISSDSFREAVEIVNSEYILGTLNTPIENEKLDILIKNYKNLKNI